MEQGLIVVVLGLAAALGWGTGDFAGGVLSRRNPVYGVMLAFQGVGLAVAVVMVIVRAEPLPSSHDLVFALVTGSVGVVGVTILYHGLAVGRMGVVAPTAGVIGASIPVGAGMVLQGVPQPVAVAGIALALVSVVLVTRSPGHDGDGPSGWQWGIAAGALTGISFTTLAQVSAASTFSVLAVLRVEALLGIGLFVLVLRCAPPRWCRPARCRRQCRVSRGGDDGHARDRRDALVAVPGGHGDPRARPAP